MEELELTPRSKIRRLLEEGDTAQTISSTSGSSASKELSSVRSAAYERLKQVVNGVQSQNQSSLNTSCHDAAVGESSSSFTPKIYGKRRAIHSVTELDRVDVAKPAVSSINDKKYGTFDAEDYGAKESTSSARIEERHGLSRSNETPIAESGEGERLLYSSIVSGPIRHRDHDDYLFENQGKHRSRDHFISYNESESSTEGITSNQTDPDNVLQHRATANSSTGILSAKVDNSGTNTVTGRSEKSHDRDDLPRKKSPKFSKKLIEKMNRESERMIRSMHLSLPSEQQKPLEISSFVEKMKAMRSENIKAQTAPLITGLQKANSDADSTNSQMAKPTEQAIGYSATLHDELPIRNKDSGQSMSYSEQQESEIVQSQKQTSVDFPPIKEENEIVFDIEGLDLQAGSSDASRKMKLFERSPKKMIVLDSDSSDSDIDEERRKHFKHKQKSLFDLYTRSKSAEHSNIGSNAKVFLPGYRSRSAGNHNTLESHNRELLAEASRRINSALKMKSAEQQDFMLSREERERATLDAEMLLERHRKLAQEADTREKLMKDSKGDGNDDNEQVGLSDDDCEYYAASQHSNEDSSAYDEDGSEAENSEAERDNVSSKLEQKAENTNQLDIAEISEQIYQSNKAADIQCNNDADLSSRLLSQLEDASSADIKDQSLGLCGRKIKRRRIESNGSESDDDITEGNTGTAVAFMEANGSLTEVFEPTLSLPSDQIQKRLELLKTRRQPIEKLVYESDEDNKQNATPANPMNFRLPATFESAKQINIEDSSDEMTDDEGQRHLANVNVSQKTVAIQMSSFSAEESVPAKKTEHIDDKDLEEEQTLRESNTQQEFRAPAVAKSLQNNEPKFKHNDLIEDQAEESEDEYAGLGGDSDLEESGNDENDSQRDLADLVDDSKISVDEAMLVAKHLESEMSADKAQTERILKDIESGNWRRGRGSAGGMFDSDDENELEQEERMARLRRKRREQFLKNQDLARLDNPKNQSFLETIEDSDEISLVSIEMEEKNVRKDHDENVGDAQQHENLRALFAEDSESNVSSYNVEDDERNSVRTAMQSETNENSMAVQPSVCGRDRLRDVHNSLDQKRKAHMVAFGRSTSLLPRFNSGAIFKKISSRSFAEYSRPKNGATVTVNMVRASAVHRCSSNKRTISMSPSTTATVTVGTGRKVHQSVQSHSFTSVLSNLR